jgi:hypothetical protein
MILARPSPAEERWLALGARLHLAGAETLLAARGGGWKRTSLVLRCALFLMGAVAASLTLSICHLLHLPHAAGVAGVILLALAELLIMRRRLFASGIEEALELAGLLLLCYEFLLPPLRTFLHGTDAFGLTAMAWTFFVAFAVAGIRLLNPLLTTLAVVLMVFAIVITAAPSWESAAWDFQASLLCYGLAAAALAGGGRTFQRPAYERMLDWLVVAMPVAGYLWAAHWTAGLPAHDYYRDHSLHALYTPVAPLAFSIAALVVGVRRRTHAPLLAALLGIACVAFELRGLTGWSLEVRFMVWGAALLLAALLVDRALRAPLRGVTSRRIGEGSGAQDVLELAAGPALRHHGPEAPAETFKGGGGQYGGGGAGGRF